MHTIRRVKFPQKIKQNKCKVLAVLVIGILSINRLYYQTIQYMPSRPKEIGNHSNSRFVSYFKHILWKNTTVKKILVWTPFFGSWTEGWVQQKTMDQCLAKCVVTTDREDLDSSDAVYFHATDLWLYRGLLGTVYQRYIEMPAKRRLDQVWVLFSMEPLIYMLWGTIPYPMNWTVYFRRESTIFAPYSINLDVPSQERYSKRDYFSEKTTFASILVSNCKDPAKRYRILHELKKYIPVDEFGRCSGNVLCRKGGCVNRYLTKYKFYLAFENSFCRDYISEKFWNALSRRQIPVIAAPKYNTELLPPGSYINVFDFPSIKDLAMYMMKIGENQTLYNSFFDWTATYKADLVSPHCKVCMALHANKTPQSYSNMDAWLNDDICYRSSFSSLIGGFLSRLLFDLGTGWF